MPIPTDLKQVILSYLPFKKLQLLDEYSTVNIFTVKVLQYLAKHRYQIDLPFSKGFLSI